MNKDIYNKLEELGYFFINNFKLYGNDNRLINKFYIISKDNIWSKEILKNLVDYLFYDIMKEYNDKVDDILEHREYKYNYEKNDIIKEVNNWKKSKHEFRYSKTGRKEYNLNFYEDEIYIPKILWIETYEDKILNLINKINSIIEELRVFESTIIYCFKEFFYNCQKFYIEFESPDDVKKDEEYYSYFEIGYNMKYYRPKGTINMYYKKNIIDKISISFFKN